MALAAPPLAPSRLMGVRRIEAANVAYEPRRSALALYIAASASRIISFADS